MTVAVRGPLGSETPVEVFVTDEGIVLSSPQLGEWGLNWDELAQIVGHPRVEDKVTEALAMQGAWV